MFDIKDDSGVFGPYSGEQVKNLAMERRLHRGMQIRRHPDGKWKPISRVKEIQRYLTTPPSENASIPAAPPPLPPQKPQPPPQVQGEAQALEQDVAQWLSQPHTRSEVGRKPQDAYRRPQSSGMPQIDVNAASGQMVSTMTAIGDYYARKKASSASHSLGIGGLVVGAIGIFLFWAPYLGLLLGGLGLIMGIVGLILAIKRSGYGIGFSIGASALCVVAILMNVPASLVLTAVIGAAKDIAEGSDPALITEFDVDEWNEIVARRNKHAQLTRKFTVLACDLQESSSDIFDRPTIYLKVRNGTRHSVCRAYFHATLRTPGREIPWIDTDFNYEIPGGLAPGETAEWYLEPNLFSSDWEHARDAKSAVFRVEVMNVDGPDGEYLYPEWSDSDEKKFRRLLQLREES